MSRAHKFHNPEGLYFVSFSVIEWKDVFTRSIYCDILIDSLKYCIAHKGLELNAYCIMTNHVHLIFRCHDNHPSHFIRDFKKFTAFKIRATIEQNSTESRRKWLINSFKLAGEKNCNTIDHKFWQHHNHPIELWSNHVIDQKLNYVHQNPVKAGIVIKPHYWKYSSASNYIGNEGVIDVVKI